ncbi:MAG: CmcJ/NvfI family oxidoreductase [Pseudomonadota bacterium]
MPRTATVNYHVHKPERQAFHIDARGEVGKLISPELAPTDVAVLDERAGEAAVAFARDGVEFAAAPTGVETFGESENWRGRYDAELTDLLSARVGAEEVVIFDHTVRVDDPNSDRTPARNVHSDYSRKGAENRLIDVLGPERAAMWSAGRYAFVNIWRPVDAPINSAPLGFVRPASVAEEDWILLDLIYPDRVGGIMGLAANPSHEWIYRAKMRPDEVAYFNIYDNQGRPSIAHSALDMVEDPAVTTIRNSIESRTVIRY